MNVFGFLEPDAIREASGDSILRRSQRANKAGVDVVKDRLAVERAAAAALKQRLGQLQAALKKRLLVDDGSVTDFKRFTLSSLLHDVDRMMADAQIDIADGAKRAYSSSTDLGDKAAEEPLRAAQLTVRPSLPGVDATLITAAFDNTIELLTQPMQQFASSVKVMLRGVALAGDQKFEAIQRLRDQIEGAGFDNAQYRAERIIRTELGRTFNQSTFERLLALSKDFPFLRKGWRAAGDSRTRTGHREAAQNYARGSGIPIGDAFQVNAYRERPGKAPVLLGVASLRFPIDPQGTPAGPVTAAATIMCRCNAFVDFDLADFAEFSRRQIQLALGGPLPPVAPGPVAVKKTPKPATVKPTPATPVAPKVAGPTDGPKVSSSLVPSLITKKMQAVYEKVSAVIDSVHSDGILKRIPLGPMSGKAYGEFAYGMIGGPKEIRMNASALKAHPFNTLAHEIGHWLDNAAVGRLEGFYRSGGPVPRVGQMNTGFITGSPLMEAWRDAVRSSETIQRLRTWAGASTSKIENPIMFQGKPVEYTGYQGDGVTPKGVNGKHLRYLLSVEEVWARAYAQYVAVRSGDAAMLAELRDMQRTVSSGPVPSSYEYNGTHRGQQPNTWRYPTVWQDDEFKPIAEAFDKIFEGMGWRSR